MVGFLFSPNVSALFPHGENYGFQKIDLPYFLAVSRHSNRRLDGKKRETSCGEIDLDVLMIFGGLESFIDASSE